MPLRSSHESFLLQNPTHDFVACSLSLIRKSPVSCPFYRLLSYNFWQNIQFSFKREPEWRKARLFVPLSLFHFIMKFSLHQKREQNWLAVNSVFPSARLMCLCVCMTHDTYTHSHELRDSFASCFALLLRLSLSIVCVTHTQHSSLHDERRVITARKGEEKREGREKERKKLNWHTFLVRLTTSRRLFLFHVWERNCMGEKRKKKPDLRFFCDAMRVTVVAAAVTLWFQSFDRILWLNFYFPNWFDPSTPFCRSLLLFCSPPWIKWQYVRCLLSHSPFYRWNWEWETVNISIDRTDSSGIRASIRSDLFLIICRLLLLLSVITLVSVMFFSDSLPFFLTESRVSANLQAVKLNLCELLCEHEEHGMNDCMCITHISAENVWYERLFC